MNKTGEDYTKVFKSKLTKYKKLIDGNIAEYSKQIQKSTLQQYGKYARLEVDSFLEVLNRGGKRIRGSLVMLGYELVQPSEGPRSDSQDNYNEAMVLRAACAIEMLHAYILIIDDIQDRSRVRRGGPAAHVALAGYHEKHGLAGNAEHFGVSIALNAALSGAHAAQMLLANLDVNENLRTKVLSIVNRTMIVTAHGQTCDIVNEAVAEVNEEDVEHVLEWKTANYTFLNPLHVGMVLAGADCPDTDAITDYALEAGRAFQISDDIIGVFGSEEESGKSPMDDIKEGKRTLLITYALEYASNGNKNFLLHMLGNNKITPAEFARCKDIILETGALDYAKKVASSHISNAIKELEKESARWSESGAGFLKGLAQYLQDRTS